MSFLKTIPLIKKIAISGFAIVSLLAVNFAIPTQAIENRGIIITPAIIELEADKGQVYSLSLDLENDTDKDQVVLVPKLYTFNQIGEDGYPELMAVEDGDPQANWIQFLDEEITVKQGEQWESKFRLTVPEEIDAGSYYFALTYTTQENQVDTSGQNVIIETEIAALLFLTVKGQVNRQVSIEDVVIENSFIDPFFDQ